ncbi:hypothetical protein V494_05963 [Pseudogymnoascus sp. VKM F-4513 (FW-928)]|nr:hypothetical protein V494_05963 [Pseudogymnoascus sp. VKM F-4513 (FW-928)]
MASPFGFFGGDFGAAVELVSTVANALSENSVARKEYSELVSELYSLETALQQVKMLKVSDSQYSELVGLRQAACRCQQTIDGFWRKTQKHQNHLRLNGSSSRLKDNWMKIRWAVCHKDDIAQFKADIAMHTESIQLLLSTVQIKSTDIAKESQEVHNIALAAKLHTGYIECLQRLSSSIGQGKQLLQIAAKILRTNLRIFQTVVAIQTTMDNLPSQIERQQPVYLIDALGKHSPFHLEFVRSAEAFTAVIKINFKALGEQAVQKIERRRFVIQDSTTKRDIDLTANWEACFQPGQHVEMSIIFTDWGRHSRTQCPKCENDCICPMDSDIKCPACGTKFRRIEDAKLNLDDIETDISRLLIGPTEPKPRSARLLDLIQRVRINVPPLEPPRVEPHLSTIGPPVF